MLVTPHRKFSLFKWINNSMTETKYLSEQIGGGATPKNSFDSIRLIAATAVIVSHSFALTFGNEDFEPLAVLTQNQSTIGVTSVAIFFVVSGLLISLSFDRTPTVMRFIRNRALRLVPGLWICIILTVLLFGPFFTVVPLGRYFTSSDTLGFLGNLFFLPAGHGMAGMFPDNPHSDAVNGSLWTLKYEVACYVIGGLLLATRKLRIPLVAASWIAALICARLIGEPKLQSGIMYHIAQMAYLFRFYGAGMLIYLFRERIPLSSFAGLCALGVLSASTQTPYFNEVLAICGAYAILVLAFNGPEWFRKIASKGDISYGVYIYAFPVQQALVPLCLKTAHPWLTNIAFAIPITYALAALSWKLVEKPALNFKKERRISGAEGRATHRA